MMIFSELTPGSFDVAETADSDYDTTVSCTGDQDPSDLTLAPDGFIECTFTNTKKGSITITKDTIPDDDTIFSFTGDLGAFTLQDNGDEFDGDVSTTPFTGLTPGLFDVSETADGNYITTVSCTDDQDPSALLLAGPRHPHPG